MKKPALLVMAAGMGSRYGGLKQIEPVGPNGEIIIDYTIHDALRAGFGKLVFVIRHYFEDAFREKIGRKFDRFAEVTYVFQELDAGLGGFEAPPDREKPWGTGHAVLVGRDAIQEPFGVVNADDFYGPNSMRLLADFLRGGGSEEVEEYAMVGFVLRNTLSEHGTVARGVCEHDGSMHLRRVVEYTKIERYGNGARQVGEDGRGTGFSGDEIVSMNLWGFQTSVFGHLKIGVEDFLARRGGDPKAEFYLPAAVDEMIRGGEARVKILPTEDEWFGVTYREDHPVAVSKVRKLIATGVYPERLQETE